MHITILALGSRGDIQPYANLGKGLKAAGHDVRFITFEGFAGLVADCALDFHPIHGDAQTLVAAAGADMLALMLSFGSLAEGYARDLSAPQLGETDLLINQLPAGLYGPELTEKYGIPMMLAAAMPLARTREFPLIGFPRLPLPGYNKLTYSCGEQMAWQMFRGVINRWHTQTLGLPPAPLSGTFDQLGTHRLPILNGFSPCVVERPADWNEHIYITGYWFPDDGHYEPPAELSAFLKAGAPPVFIGFGSMPIKDARRTTDIIVAALQQSGQRAVLQAGWGGLGDQKLPDSILKIRYAPYEWLFPRMSMVIHHGGAGTTGMALRSGIPSCAVPFVFDQFYWGKRIADLGTGPAPIPHKQLTVGRLVKAIKIGTGSIPMQQRAAVLGENIRGEDGIGTAISVIEQLLRSRRKASTSQ